MLSRLKRLVQWPVGCVALAMAAFVSGCGGGGPLESDLVFSGDVSSGNLKPKDYPIHGIDVSKFQGDIDWNAVANSGVKFAWIKATEGGDRDARFQANWEGAKAAGIPHGAYHFIYWCRPPLEEIQIFEQNAPVEDDALPPVLDAEATPTSPTCRRHVTQDEAIADMQVMLQEMERHYRKRPIIYTTLDCERTIRPRSFERWPGGRRRSTRAGGFCRWLRSGTEWIGALRRRSGAWTARRCATGSIASTRRVRRA